MFIPSSFLRCLALAAALTTALPGARPNQDAAAPAKAPLDHVIGTIKSVDSAAHTVTVEEDKTAAVNTIQLANTKTLLKVEPAAKDLKSALRIMPGDLEVGDRVDVRGSKLPDTTTLAARSVILMSGRALAVTHQQQTEAWSHATTGIVTVVDPSGVITANVRTAGATQPIAVKTGPSTEFTRYSTDTGKAAPSQLAQIQTGDQLKVIGEKSEDGASITAQRVYSGAFRTISATIASLGADGKSMTVKDLSNKKDVNITLNADAAIHKLPPTMAGFLAHRLNPNAAAPGGAPGGSRNGSPNGYPGGTPNGGAASGPTGAGAGGGAPATGAEAGSPGGMPHGSGDISQMIEHLPQIGLTDLKPGDALVISGVATGDDHSSLLANTVIAGVEPILQAAPQQRGGGRAVGGDWGLGEISTPQ